MSPRPQRWAGLLVAALWCTSSASAQGEAPEGPLLTHAEQVVARVLPSVVKVYGAGGFTGIPAYGTGVLVHERGFVLTSWSIALRTDALKVVTHDGQRFAATLWAADPGLGGAVLRVEGAGAGFKALRLGDSSGLRPGDPVLGLGNAFGIIYGDEQPAAFRGVVAGLADPRRPGVRILRLPGELEQVILTDIPSNPGTQGGPLLSLGGELVGILGRLVESRATNTVLSYAVPAASLTELVDAALAANEAPGEQREPTPARPPRRAAEDLGIHLQRAHLVRSPLAYVERVVRDSPAGRSGLQPDDLIFRIGPRTIRSCRDVDEAFAQLAAGSPVRVVVKRGSRLLDLELEGP